MAFSCFFVADPFSCFSCFFVGRSAFFVAFSCFFVADPFSCFSWAGAFFSWPFRVSSCPLPVLRLRVAFRPVVTIYKHLRRCYREIDR